MAGHSQFKNIMHRKGRQDKVKSKLFGKLAREITVSAKLGLPDPAMNPRLRAAMLAARAENMPKDNIDRAIKKAIGGDAENYDEIPYEGLWARRRGGRGRGPDRQPQPHRRRSARGLHQVGRQSRRGPARVSFVFDDVGPGCTHDPPVITQGEMHVLGRAAESEARCPRNRWWPKRKRVPMTNPISRPQWSPSCPRTVSRQTALGGRWRGTRKQCRGGTHSPPGVMTNAPPRISPLRDRL